MNLTPIEPSDIVLLATLRCTAACDNCCFGCNSRQGRTMTFGEMKGYIDKSLEAYPDSISHLDLTGGECMLLGKDVDRIFSYAKGRGLTCSMVSNAFWATDYDKAFKTLKRLKRSGLVSVSFSTGGDHNRYVPWMNVRHAAVAAAHLGLRVGCRMEGWYGSRDIERALKADAEFSNLVEKRKLGFSESPWVNYHNEGKKPRSRKVDFYDGGSKDVCNSLFGSININPYGEVYACCGLGNCRIPQLRLGNIHEEPIKAIYERAFEDFLKIWLFTEGPQAVLKFVHGKTGQKFNGHTSHICDICRVIFTDKTILPLIRENFFSVAYTPLISYGIKAKHLNESRRKR